MIASPLLSANLWWRSTSRQMQRNGSTLTATATNRNTVVEAYWQNNQHDDTLQTEIRQQAASLQEFLVQHRRHLHQIPEVMYQEAETSRHIQTVLDDLGVPFTTGWAKNIHENVFPGPGGYGVVADIGTGQEPCVLLRADMDALPIHEETAVDFASTKTNRMHACGHDGHTTMLLGAGE